MDVLPEDEAELIQMKEWFGHEADIHREKPGRLDDEARG